MASMADAEAVIRRLDERLAELGDPAYHQRVLDAFTDSLNDFRADGDPSASLRAGLDAHVGRCRRLLDEALARTTPASTALFTPRRTLLRAWTSVFSSG